MYFIKYIYINISQHFFLMDGNSVRFKIKYEMFLRGSFVNVLKKKLLTFSIRCFLTTRSIKVLRKVHIKNVNTQKTDR